MNYEAVYRTAPATPGLLKIATLFPFLHRKKKGILNTWFPTFCRSDSTISDLSELEKLLKQGEVGLVKVGIIM